MAADQPAGDGRAGAVEVRRAMGRLTQQDHAAFGEAVEQRGKVVVDIVERLGDAGDGRGRVCGPFQRHSAPG